MLELLPWILAALAGGLWWGERGRRLDAQTRESVLPARRRRARVSGPAPARADGLAEDDQVDDTSVMREKLIEQCIAEGYSRKDAERDVDAMLSNLPSDAGHPSTW